jgi:hypothetical protein
MLEQRRKDNKRSRAASQNAVIKKQQCGHNQIKYVNYYGQKANNNDHDG